MVSLTASMPHKHVQPRQLANLGTCCFEVFYLLLKICSLLCQLPSSYWSTMHRPGHLTTHWQNPFIHHGVGVLSNTFDNIGLLATKDLDCLSCEDAESEQLWFSDPPCGLQFEETLLKQLFVKTVSENCLATASFVEVTVYPCRPLFSFFSDGQASLGTPRVVKLKPFHTMSSDVA